MMPRRWMKFTSRSQSGLAPGFRAALAASVKAVKNLAPRHSQKPEPDALRQLTPALLEVRSPSRELEGLGRLLSGRNAIPRIRKVAHGRC
jgi:hypothetical protein